MWPNWSQLMAHFCDSLRALRRHRCAGTASTNCVTASAEIPKVFDTEWETTSWSVKINGGNVEGIHCTNLVTKEVVGNQGTNLVMKCFVENRSLLRDGWNVDTDVLTKVKDINRQLLDVTLGPCDGVIAHPSRESNWTVDLLHGYRQS